MHREPDDLVARALKILKGEHREPSEKVLIEPAAVNARPVYWETANGRILGPAVPECLAQVGAEFWIVATFEDQPRWIRADRLRSRNAFEQQPEVQEVERIPTGIF